MNKKKYPYLIKLIYIITMINDREQEKKPHCIQIMRTIYKDWI